MCPCNRVDFPRDRQVHVYARHTTPNPRHVEMDPIREELAVQELLRLVKDPNFVKFEQLAEELKADPEAMKAAAIRLGVLYRRESTERAVRSLRAALYHCPSFAPGKHFYVAGAEWNWGSHVNEIVSVLRTVTGFHVTLLNGSHPDSDGPIGCSPSIQVDSESPCDQHDEFLERVLVAKREEVDRMAEKLSAKKRGRSE